MNEMFINIKNSNLFIVNIIASPAIESIFDSSLIKMIELFPFLGEKALTELSIVFERFHSTPPSRHDN